MRTVRHAIDRIAALRGDAPFLIAPGTGEVVTFARLRDDSQALASRLASRGLVKGDRVAFLLDNGLFTAELLLGTLYAGLVAVPLDTGAGRARLDYAVKHSKARALFVTPDHEHLLDGEPARERRGMVVLAHPDRGPDWSDPLVPDGALPDVDEDHDALLAYTSGTTGQPKGVLLTHSSIIAAGANVVGAYGLSAEDRSLCVLPLSHRNAQNTTVMATLLSGGSVVLPGRFDVTSFWELVVRHRCTWFALVPTIISQLLSRTEPPAAGALAHVRFARSSAAPLPPATHQEFEARFRVPLVEGMGATEAGSAIFFTPLPPALRKVGSPGPAFGFDVKVVDMNGRSLPVGLTGEIAVRGPSVMKEYYEDPAATAEVLAPDGWLRTGDLGYLDEDGYVFVVGRARELINKAGVMIAPREIDEVLLQHPAVLEAATVGVPDAYLGQDIVAYVVLRPGATCRAGELLAFCNRELGYFTCPTSIRLVEGLPRGPAGKVQRHQLVEEASRRSQLPAGAPRSHPHRGPSGYVAPRTPVEQVMCEAWGAVLEREPIGVHDEFFALGGDSLQAMRILARLSVTLPASLSFGTFIEHPTIAEQAHLVDFELLRGVGDEAALRLLQVVERLSDGEAAAWRSEDRDEPLPSEGP